MRTKKVILHRADIYCNIVISHSNIDLIAMKLCTTYIHALLLHTCLMLLLNY